MSLGELQEMVADRQAWHDAVPGVTESGKTQQLNNKALTIIHHSESASQTTVRCHFVPTPTARITESDDKRGKNTEKTSAWARTSGVQVRCKTCTQTATTASVTPKCGPPACPMQREPGLLSQRSAIWTEEGALTAPGGWPSGRRAARRRLVGRRRHTQAAPSRRTQRGAEKAAAGRGCTRPGR